MAEELQTHKCLGVKDYKIIEKTLWVFDGQMWYPLKLSANNKGLRKRTMTDNNDK